MFIMLYDCARHCACYDVAHLVNQIVIYHKIAFNDGGIQHALLFFIDLTTIFFKFKTDKQRSRTTCSSHAKFEIMAFCRF